MDVPYQTVALFISLSAMISYDWLLTLVMTAIALISILLNKIDGFEISIKNLISQIYAQDASKKYRQAFNPKHVVESILLFKKYTDILLMKIKSF